MIEFVDALKLVLEHSSRLPVERVPVENCIGRVLADDLVSSIEMPPMNKSAMDGYALKAADVTNTPAKLKCVGIVQAGHSFSGEIKGGECVKIMTGAPLCKGADCVIMVEDTHIDGNVVTIHEGVLPGKNVCLQGEDIKSGDVVLKQGVRISSSHVPVIAAIGMAKVNVYKLPSVAIVSTGTEIIPVGNPLGDYQIYNSNGPMFVSMINDGGYDCNYLGAVEDSQDALISVFKEGLKSDIFLISGGVSMGDFDFVPSVLNKLGVKKIFHKVRMKPGKPFFFGKKDETLVFGLPGNPISGYLGFQLFVLSSIKKMMGVEEWQCSPVIMRGVLDADFTQTAGDRKNFVLIKINKKDSQYRIVASNGNGSADIKTLAACDGVMMIEHSIPELKKGTEVEFISWKIMEK